MLPEAVLVLGLTLFLVDEPDAATSAFRSSRALALMAVAAVAWVGLRVLLARVLPLPLARAAVFAVGAAAVLAVVVIPAYDDDTVVETFPAALGAPANAAAPDTVAATTTAPTTTAATTAASAPPAAPATPT
ncbi:MAG: hypothetical protein ACRD0N_12905, partial [Acidimicrobiales bacterium]